MSGKRVSKFGKRVVEGDMSTVALQEAIKFHDALMDAEFKGRKDNESAARFRLAKKTGVPESYLFRLNYKRHEMRDVAGEVYRLLRQGYEQICAHIENAADAVEAKRIEIEASHATEKSPAPAGEGNQAAHTRVAEEEKS